MPLVVTVLAVLIGAAIFGGVALMCALALALIILWLIAYVLDLVIRCL